MLNAKCQIINDPLRISNHIFCGVYSLFCESMKIVVGPSLRRETFISAPNSPVPTVLPRSELTFAQNFSYIGIAKSCFDALIYEGRLPFFVEACNVNWLTINISPSTSLTERFITLFASSKIRIFTILFDNHSISASVSLSSTPTSTSKPLPIDDLIFPSISTEQCVTF